MDRPHEIDSFESYIENGKVERKHKDPGRAEGLDMVDINTFNRYRKLRNDLVYRGDKATVEEAKDMRRFYRELQSELLEK